MMPHKFVTQNLKPATVLYLLNRTLKQKRWKQRQAKNDYNERI